jgi:ADP-heptose:LPS heptosyltransferase
VQFFSLQKGRGEQEVRTLAQEQAMVDVTHSFQDFADTAAVVEQLDLVISVDTAVAHLSAALGTPCWLLLPAYLTDWRWMHARADSPWYPGVMRLFRQFPGQGWAPVVEQVRAALMAQPAGSA